MVTTFTYTQSQAPKAASRVNAPTIVLPYLSEKTGVNEREIYMSFIHAFREAPHRRMEVRILTAILRAADATDNSDAYIARVLVDMGLQAPRLAFPGDFLDHVEATLLRDRPLQTVPASYVALARHWAAIGEDLYAFSRSEWSAENRLQSFVTTV